MNAAQLVHILWLERKFWKREGTSEEAKWVIRGIEIGMSAIRRVAHEERARRKRRAPHIARWASSDLFAAIRSAYRALQTGNGRTRAMGILGGAIERFGGNHGHTADH